MKKIIKYDREQNTRGFYFFHSYNSFIAAETSFCLLAIYEVRFSTFIFYMIIDKKKQR